MTVFEEDEQSYRETARLINNIIDKYINLYGGNADLNYENFLIMALLELGAIKKSKRARINLWASI